MRGQDRIEMHIAMFEGQHRIEIGTLPCSKDTTNVKFYEWNTITDKHRKFTDSIHIISSASVCLKFVAIYVGILTITKAMPIHEQKKIMKEKKKSICSLQAHESKWNLWWFRMTKKSGMPDLCSHPIRNCASNIHLRYIDFTSPEEREMMRLLIAHKSNENI